MLFDLAAPGRKRLIQAVYLVLAVVLVGGLIFFGVGSGLPGVFDGNNQGGGGDLAKEQRDRVERLEKEVVQKPRDGKVLAALASARYDIAVGQIDPDTGAVSDEARRGFQGAADAWTRYLATDPERVDETTAKKMVTVFSPSILNKPGQWADAQAVVTAAAIARAERAGTRPPFAQYLALMQANLAADRKRQAKINGQDAIAAARPNQRTAVRQQVEALEKGGKDAALGQGQATATTPQTITLPDE
jgi:hypothetical protein